MKGFSSDHVPVYIVMDLSEISDGFQQQKTSPPLYQHSWDSHTKVLNSEVKISAQSPFKTSTDELISQNNDKQGRNSCFLCIMGGYGGSACQQC